MADYHTEFDPKSYLEMYNKVFDPSNDDKGLLKFRMKPLHAFWSNFETGSSRSASGGVRCLEYGGGPCIANLISASTKVDRIVFAEYTENNRQAVNSWLAGSPEAYDWSLLIQFVVRDLEGDSTAQAISNRQEELKQKIRSIVLCDVAKNPIVDLECVDVGKPFDVVTTSLCVEVCATSEKQYKSSIAKLCKFLKPNGFLIMFGVLNETYYTVGNVKFQHFPVTQSMIEEAMKGGGIQGIIVEVFDIEYMKVEHLTDAKSFFFAIGRMSGTEEKL